MKRQFREINFRQASLNLIVQSNRIIREYQDMGYRLSLRQLYYQLVSRDIIPNRVAEYKKLSKLLTDARYAGLVNWSALEDRTRQMRLPYWNVDKSEALRETAEQYRLDRQKGQNKHIEIWVEKDALSEVLYRVTGRFHVPLMVNKGYSSASAMYKAAGRLSREERTRESLIYYIGDHDPSGLDMVRDIQDRLREFGSTVQVVHIALTMEQIEEHNTPPNPAKESDPRSDWYITEFGDTSWEVDALPVNVLDELVSSTIEHNIDMGLYETILEQEREDKRDLREIADRFEGEED